MKKLKTFISSSSDLRTDRDRILIYFEKINKKLYEKGIIIEAHSWENMVNLSQTRMQDEFNRLISESDILIMLFFDKVGQFTKKEFSIAFGSYQERKRPFIFTYFKDAPVNVFNLKRSDLQSLWEFQDQLSNLGYLYQKYQNLDELEVLLNHEIERLIKSDFEVRNKKPVKSDQDREKNLVKTIIGDSNKVIQDITSGKDSNINISE